jgi:hypothetical protein
MITFLIPSSFHDSSSLSLYCRRHIADDEKFTWNYVQIDITYAYISIDCKYNITTWNDIADF